MLEEEIIVNCANAMGRDAVKLVFHEFNQFVGEIIAKNELRKLEIFPEKAGNSSRVYIK